MNKLVRDTEQSHCAQLLHIKDKAHLVHVTIDYSIHSQPMNDVHKVVTQFGAVFKHAAKRERLFHDICRRNNLADEESQKPPSVTPTRWFSFYKSAVAVRHLWSVLLSFIDDSESSGEKINELRMLIGDQKNRQMLLVKHKHLIETLAPIHALQEVLESSKPMLHQMYHLVNVRLKVQFSAKLTDEPQLDANTTMVLSMLSVADTSLVKADLVGFNKSLGEKWQATCARNLREDVCGSEGLWKKAVVLDPFLKLSQSQDFMS
uniref:Uncharacterized protein n=1 Tax=Amphimedon queenslandica TaxID=400682 RepID=A0A1X7UC00_AMPQE